MNIITGPEFGPSSHCTCTSGARWHDWYANVMCIMLGFHSCKADPDVWTQFRPLVHPIHFWIGETIINKPFPLIFKATKDDPRSNLWAVTVESSFGDFA